MPDFDHSPSVPGPGLRKMMRFWLRKARRYSSLAHRAELAGQVNRAIRVRFRVRFYLALIRGFRMCSDDLVYCGQRYSDPFDLPCFKPRLPADPVPAPPCSPDPDDAGRNTLSGRAARPVPDVADPCLPDDAGRNTPGGRAASPAPALESFRCAGAGLACPAAPSGPRDCPTAHQSGPDLGLAAGHKAPARPDLSAAGYPGRHPRSGASSFQTGGPDGLRACTAITPRNAGLEARTATPRALINPLLLLSQPPP